MLSLKEASKLLQSAKERKDKGLFIIEGKKMVTEALSIKGAVDCLFMTESLAGSAHGKELLEGVSCDVSVVPDSSLKKVSGLVTPEGVMAAVSVEAVGNAFGSRLEEGFKKGFPILFLEDLQDPGNLGTIIRTAEAAGVSEIVLSKDTVDPFSPKVVRSTMGSIFRTPVFKCGSEDAFYDNIREKRRRDFPFMPQLFRGRELIPILSLGKRLPF